jgi:hypothetical protein
MLVPLASLAVLVTVVVPTGKVLPDGGVETTFGIPPHESLAVTLKNTTAGPTAVTVMGGGQVMDTMQLLVGVTVTVKLHMFVPVLSLAVLNTVVVPIGKVLPDGGVETTFGIPPQESLAVTLKNTTAPLPLVAATMMLEGHVIDTTQLLVAAFTVTVKLHMAASPQVSEAVTFTVVVPTGKVLPLGGTAFTSGTLHPPPAVAVKNTTAPLLLVAVTVIFDGHVTSTAVGVFVDCGWCVIVPGPLVVGDHVFPPSRLNSVKMSKKLLIWKAPGALLPTLVRPIDGTVGLCRTSIPGGSEPPVKFNCVISVSKYVVEP